jgi:hypothetical protein
VRAATASVDGASRWQVLCDGREIMRKLRELFGSLIESIAKRICSLVLVTSVAIVPATSTPVGATPIKQFLANLNGGQVAPPKDVFSFAVAHLFFEEESAMLCFSITYSNLSSFETAAHIHGPADPSVAGDILFTLPAGYSKHDCVGPLSKEQRRDLLRNRWYLDAHTTNFPDGEIRGQILRIR